MESNIGVMGTAALLRSLDNIHIYTHINPDGDALGSAYALAAILKKMKKSVKVVCLDTLPKYLSHVWDVENEDVKCRNVITVDVADMSLLGDFDRSLDIVLAIDHHRETRVDAENILSIPEMAATGEIIYDLAVELGITFDRYIAECLYTAISTDTGCFKFSNATYHTFMCVAALTRYVPNGNFGYLNLPLFITKPINKMQFESDIISRLRFLFDGRVSVSVVTNDIIKRHGLTDDETGGVEQLGKAPEGVELAITLKEREGGFKVSMRSTDTLDCSDICAHFGGGGHRAASGCFIEGSAEDIVEMLVSYIKEKGIL